MARVGGTWTGRFLVGVLVVAFVAAALPAPAGATHAWGSYHWGRTANPFTLTVVDSMVDTSAGLWDTHLQDAIGDWSNGSVAMELAYVVGDTSGAARKRCTAISGKVRACNAEYGRTGWLGIASIWASGDHITQATAKMNDTYYNTATYNTPAWRDFVVCQEIGHDFGLGHQDEGFDNPNLGSCMDYTNDPDGTKAEPDQLSNRDPDTHDYQMVDTIHSLHGDTSNTFATATTRTVGQSGVEIPDPVGPEQGGVSVFVTDLGGGNRVIQVVIWADANLMAATHAAEQAPFDEVTTDEEGISPDGAPIDSHEETTEATAGGFAVGTTVVTVDVVNLRTAASRQAEVVTELAAGTALTVTGVVEEGQGLVWVTVATADGTLAGYVAADFLTQA